MLTVHAYSKCCAISFVLLQPTIRKLWNFKLLKIGQNGHANMEGFCRGSHKYQRSDATSQEHLGSVSDNINLWTMHMGINTIVTKKFKE